MTKCLLLLTFITILSQHLSFDLRLKNSREINRLFSSNNNMMKPNSNFIPPTKTTNDLGGEPQPMMERSLVPSRNDVCKLFVSGVIGNDPKENYLSNGHYVVSFSLATVGHFTAQHDWERYKPTETMWLNVEVWDNLAKEAFSYSYLKKGAQFSGMGTLISNKWTDKATGEEKKALKVRIQNVMTREDLAALDFEVDNSVKNDASKFEGDSNFSSSEYKIEDQTLSPTEVGSPNNAWFKGGSGSKYNKDAQDNSRRDPRIPF